MAKKKRRNKKRREAKKEIQVFGRIDHNADTSLINEDIGVPAQRSEADKPVIAENQK